MGPHARAARPWGAARSVEVTDDVEALAGEWQALALSVDAPNFFNRPSVLKAWDRHLAEGAEWRVIAVRRDGRLVAVLPVMRGMAWRGPTLGVRHDYDPRDRRHLARAGARLVPLRQIVPVTSIPATMGAAPVLMRPGALPDVVDGVCEALAQWRGWDLMVLPVAVEDLEPWRAGMAAWGLRCDVQPLDRTILRLAAVRRSEALFALLTQKGRQNVRRAARAAAQAGITSRIEHDAGRSLALLRDVAARSWKAKGGADRDIVVPYEGAQRTFFEYQLGGPDRGAVVSAVAWRGDAPIAIATGVECGAVLTTLLTFWTGDQPDARPGMACLAALVDWAAKNGMRMVDFNATSAWIQPLTDRCEVQHNLLVYAPGLAGTALRGLRRAALRLRGGPGR